MQRHGAARLGVDSPSLRPAPGERGRALGVAPPALSGGGTRRVVEAESGRLALGLAALLEDAHRTAPRGLALMSRCNITSGVHSDRSHTHMNKDDLILERTTGTTRDRPHHKAPPPHGSAPTSLHPHMAPPPPFPLATGRQPSPVALFTTPLLFSFWTMIIPSSFYPQ
ncbi:hypothetical protein EYF80_062237 [Liparis tanakae]|uniref:Uncharacterized protein n=1 Tax=Liparis tanakae TaxID=230148 RepID=A0A4Z2EFF7_9TELE|nr:hypothetical protein EYF80_062237 [Liparis tanakae]